MKKQIYLFSALLMLAMLILFLATIQITRQNNLLTAQNTVVRNTEKFILAFGHNNDLDMANSWGDTRISIISLQGELLADSHLRNFFPDDNYLTRPEVIAAIGSTPAIYQRFSDTWQRASIYYARQIFVRDADPVIVRASLPLESVNAYLRQSLPLLLFLLVAIAIAAFFLTRRMAGRVMLPFAAIEQRLLQLSYNKVRMHKNLAQVSLPEHEKANGVSILQNTSFPEFDNITKEIDAIAVTLQNNIAELEEEKNKLAYILNNITDGLFVVDENMSITLVNSAALEIYNASSGFKYTRLNYLVSDTTLLTAVEDCIKNERNSLQDITEGGKIYLCAINRLPSAKLTMITFTNVTESRENQKQREEFFANASHELKTPLTAIKGFSELVSIHNQDENLTKYITAINRETARMMQLIIDMLALSKLENTQEAVALEISISKIIAEVKDVLSAQILEKQIKFETAGDAVVMAQPDHMYEVIKNLVENAIRYNETGGKITIKVKQSKKGASITVTDTGIGIAPEEQHKIFERFYRVEKSRNSWSGGTGLGLSIVKHICAIYGWRLKLTSKFRVGTSVVVEM